MPISHVLILGAGPAGLAAAVALSQLSAASNEASFRITVLELRSELTTLGGSINLTPLALRYLDRLGVGVRLRPKGIPVRAIEMLSHRTGRSLGNVWANLDTLRVMRHDLVTAMLETAKTPEHSERITVRYGARVVAIREDGSPESEDGKVALTLESGEEVQGDVLLGCDGLHSVARAKYVEPERRAVYSGKGGAYGFAEVKQPGKVDVMQSDGKPALVDSSMITGRYGSLLLSFFEESRCRVYVTAVMDVKQEHEGSKEGWRAMGEDKARIKKDILTKFDGGRVAGLTDFVGKVDDWAFYPVYLMPPNGRWTRGRVILLGDAAHAMPPQGESTGVAIEDGMLIAHVFQRHKSRCVAQLLRDYESLRRSTIDRLYKQTVWRWENAAGGKSSWIWAILMEWITVCILMIMNLKKEDYFASDVSRLALPS